MAKYHVTSNWDGKDLQTAAQRLGEVEAIEMFMEKWQTEDDAFAADQVTKIYLYATLEEAQEHRDIYGGEILEINDEYLEVFEDWTEGFKVLAVRGSISSSDIKRI